MRKFYSFLFALFLIVPANTRAQELLQNTDFSDGIAPWTGDVKNAADLAGTDSDIPTGTKGMVIQLDLDHWTKASVEFDLTCEMARFDFEYDLAKGTQFSTSEHKVSEGLSSLDANVPFMEKPHPNQFIWAQINNDPLERSRYQPLPLPGMGTDHKYKIGSFLRCHTLPQKTTVVIAFPPGHGAVIVTHVSIKDLTAQIHGTGNNAALLAKGDEVLKNADFSDGANYWNGDCKPAGADATRDFVSNSQVTKGITIDLHPSTWTKVTQNIRPKFGGGGFLTVEYSVSSDFKMSDDPKSYENIPNSIGFGDAQLHYPSGSIILMIDEAPPSRASIENAGAVYKATVHPDIVSAAYLAPQPGAIVHTFTGSLSSTVFGGDPTFCLAVPPGQGSITITKISLKKLVQATDSSSGQSSGTPANSESQTTSQQPANQ